MDLAAERFTGKIGLEIPLKHTQVYFYNYLYHVCISITTYTMINNKFLQILNKVHNHYACKSLALAGHTRTWLEEAFLTIHRGQEHPGLKEHAALRETNYENDNRPQLTQNNERKRKPDEGINRKELGWIRVGPAG